VYVPKVFVEQYDLKKFGISDEDAKYYKEAFENPDSDEYYDAWDDLLREAKTKDGETITQADGDLFLVPEGYEYDDFYAKGGKTKNLPTKQDVLHFQEYVFSFYGKGGLQADAFDGGATTEEILLATNQYLTFCARNTDLWGGGDTADREYVRDIMLYHRGVDIDDLFYGNLIKKIKKTTILEYGGILQPMIGGVNADPRFDIYNTTMFAEDGAMLDDGKKMRRGGFVTTMDDLIASAELIHYATAKMKEGDADKVLNFAYTDYGGDFFDKVAIEYFEEEYPDNIVVENTMYSGKNAIVFGEPAREFAEASERYLLGFEGIEDFYYQKQYEQEREDFERFLEDMEKYNNYKASPEAINWLMENKSGYYTILPSGLDYSESDLEEELVNEGLLEKNEEMAKGGKTKGRVEEDSDDVARKQQKNLIRRVKKQINEDRVDNWYEAIEELLSFAPKNDLADYVGTRSSDKKLLEKGAKKIAKDVFAKDENADELLSLIPIKNLATFIGDDDEYARGGKIKDQYKQFPKGSFKREKGVWNAWTPTQRLHFLNDHARELLHFGWGIAESDFGKISKLDYDGLMDEDNTGDSEIFVSVNDALNKHIREGQYADGGKTMSRKVLTRRYLQGRAQNVFTFGYGMPKDAIDMYGTKGGSEYFVMPNGDVYKKTTADMHKFELIDVKDKS
jgi:hypothetical protein